ncbi:MAG: diaminopimelate epimerase [Candidatus Omnitrophica bacterium]|nr:diaminopimelate epimerase [Candidatus Omnitrophota bacterium]
MQRINFVKAVASGNDFIIIDATRYPLPATRLYKKLAKELCKRKFGIGADGLLLVEPSQKADFRMRIFNPDGSEAEMCGNGARCAALHATRKRTQEKKIKIETKAGIVEAEIQTRYPQNIKIKMPQPKNFKLDIPLKIDNKSISVSFVNLGVPHAVVFVKNLEKVDVQNLGRKIREHQEFQPEGTNVNFVQVLTGETVRIRTYERGVEEETLSCGTGSVAAAIIAERKAQSTKRKLPRTAPNSPEGQAYGAGKTTGQAEHKINPVGNFAKNSLNSKGVSHIAKVISKRVNVHTQGEILKVYLDEQLKDVYLEGEARIIYFGSIVNATKQV